MDVWTRRKMSYIAFRALAPAGEVRRHPIYTFPPLYAAFSAAPVEWCDYTPPPYTAQYPTSFCEEMLHSSSACSLFIIFFHLLRFFYYYFCSYFLKRLLVSWMYFMFLLKMFVQCALGCFRAAKGPVFPEISGLFAEFGRFFLDRCPARRL